MAPRASVTSYSSPAQTLCVCACLVVSLSEFNQFSLDVPRIDGSLISTFPILPPSVRHASAKKMDLQIKKKNMHTMPLTRTRSHTRSHAVMCTIGMCGRLPERLNPRLQSEIANTIEDIKCVRVCACWQTCAGASACIDNGISGYIPSYYCKSERLSRPLTQSRSP